MESLNDRIALAGSSRIAFVGLCAGAGKTTALKHALAGLAERRIPCGVAAAGRRDEDLEARGGPASFQLQVAEGMIVATTAAALARSTADLDTLEVVDCSTSVGQVFVTRVRRDGDVEVIGPGTGLDLRKTVDAAR